MIYRESDKHAYGLNGVAKIYNSLDGKQWTFLKEFSVDGVDLRDPKFSIDGNKLSVYLHGSVWLRGGVVESRDFISNLNKVEWSNLQQVLLDNKKSGTTKIIGNESWPWRVTWYKDVAYVFGYNGKGIFDLYTSRDGINFANDGEYFDKIGAIPTEATIRVDKNGVFYCFVRRNEGSSVLLKSTNKGEKWETIGEIPIVSIGGPNFVFYKNGLIFSGRDNGKVIVGYFDLTNNSYSKFKTLPSGGDCGYPGMVIKDNDLWISYYSAHENKISTAIYLSKIDLTTIN
ncbi:sialidase family protein [Flavobacterium ginsengisoli]|uniref:sialidase family protein n=1 Tax=Flavobacterium ginsengisoli TaxID=871694 RepID=UPI002415108F|nr:sialidase family protein [Flavobacterium ginsengisoli]